MLHTVRLSQNYLTTKGLGAGRFSRHELKIPMLAQGGCDSDSFMSSSLNGQDRCAHSIALNTCWWQTFATVTQDIEAACQEAPELFDIANTMCRVSAVLSRVWSTWCQWFTTHCSGCPVQASFASRSWDSWSWTATNWLPYLSPSAAFRNWGCWMCPGIGYRNCHKALLSWQACRFWMQHAIDCKTSQRHLVGRVATLLAESWGPFVTLNSILHTVEIDLSVNVCPWLTACSSSWGIGKLLRPGFVVSQISFSCLNMISMQDEPIVSLNTACVSQKLTKLCQWRIEPWGFVECTAD